MENPSRKFEICAEAGPNQTMLPRHYIRRKFKAEKHLDLSGEDLCDKCLFGIERDVYSVKELIEEWTCEYEKCTQPANFYNCTWQYLCYMCSVRTYGQIHCPAGKSTSNRIRFNVVVDVETTSISGRKCKSNRR